MNTSGKCPIQKGRSPVPYAYSRLLATRATSATAAEAIFADTAALLPLERASAPWLLASEPLPVLLEVPASVELSVELSDEEEEDDDELAGSVSSGNEKLEGAASQPSPSDEHTEQICAYSVRLQPYWALAHLGLFS
jgi:hypothetical protein